MAFLSEKEQMQNLDMHEGRKPVNWDLKQVEHAKLTNMEGELKFGPANAQGKAWSKSIGKY